MHFHCCTRQNPYTCPPGPHGHTIEELFEKLAKNPEAFEWTMQQMWNKGQGKEDKAA